MIDYSSHGFTLPIERDGAQGYASINSEMYNDDGGLDFTGTYFVYLLHPQYGSTKFSLEPDNSYDGWEKEGGAHWLEKDIIQEITSAIEEHFKRGK